MEPTIQSLPAFVVVGVRHLGGIHGGEIPALWEQWGATLSTLPSAKPGIFYGLTLDFQGATLTIDYLAAVPAAPELPTPEGLVRVEIPAQTYAVFDCTLATLSQTIMATYSEWLPGSGYQRGNGPEFEHYDESFDTPEKPLTFWLPITGSVTGS
jgi:predicted transcriptional regulator YdeE